MSGLGNDFANPTLQMSRGFFIGDGDQVLEDTGHAEIENATITPIQKVVTRNAVQVRFIFHGKLPVLLGSPEARELIPIDCIQ